MDSGRLKKRSGLSRLAESRGLIQSPDSSSADIQERARASHSPNVENSDDSDFGPSSTRFNRRREPDRKADLSDDSDRLPASSSSRFNRGQRKTSDNTTDSNSPPRYGNRDNSPPRYGKRDNSPPRYGKRDNSPPRYGKRDSSPPLYGKRDSSPPRFGKRDSSPPRFGKRDSSPPLLGNRNSDSEEDYGGLNRKSNGRNQLRVTADVNRFPSDLNSHTIRGNSPVGGDRSTFRKSSPDFLKNHKLPSYDHVMSLPSDSDEDNNPPTFRKKSDDSLDHTFSKNDFSSKRSARSAATPSPRPGSPKLSSSRKKSTEKSRLSNSRKMGKTDDEDLTRTHSSQDLDRLRTSVSLDRLNSWGSAANVNQSKRLNKMERRLNSAQSMNNMETMSNQSFTSTTSSLKKIPTQDMKKKPFLVGSLAATALLGADQLDSLLPERQLDVMVITWNMAKLGNKLYPSSFDSLFFPDDVEHVPEIYVFCTQETNADKKELLLRCQATMGPNHLLFDYCVNKSLLVAVFIRRDLLWFVSIPDQAVVTTRPARIATKGSTAICFTLFGSSMLFMCSHFSQDDGCLEDRVLDYQKTIAKLDLPKFTKTSYVQSEDVTERFDYVFWAGDLNFRIVTCNQNRKMIDDVIQGISSKSHPQYEVLLSGDELKTAQSESRIFENFQEGSIKFPPTYKFDMDSDVYDSSPKMRIPSYTDRILFRCNKHGKASCQVYNSVTDIKCSDHRAVYGVYTVLIRPGIDNIPLAAGQFCRDIYKEGNRRRALQLDLASLRDEKPSSSVCSVM